MANTNQSKTRSAEKGSRTDKYSKTYQGLADIWTVLSKYASPDHPMTSGEIQKKLQHSELPPSQSTIERHLTEGTVAFNTLFPGNILYQQSQIAPLQVYAKDDRLHLVLQTPEVHLQIYAKDEKLHVVLETPDSDPLWSAQVPLEGSRQPSDDTITRTLLQLSSLTYEQGLHPPVEVKCVEAVKSGLRTRYESYQGLHPNTPRRYYLEGVLSTAEWRILADLILVYPYITEEQTTTFLKALERLAPGKVNWTGQRFVRKQESGVQFLHLDLLDEAIQKKQQVSVAYGEYRLEFGEDGFWTPKLHSKTASGQNTVVDPYALMWSNGYYYLVCKENGKMRNLRVDRLLAVFPLTTTFTVDPGFDPRTYRDRTPVMYAGEPQYTRIRCHDSKLNTLMDFFGTTITRFSKTPGTDDFTVTLSAAPEGTELFALQYADCVEVLEPDILRDRIRTTLTKALKQYSK